MNLSAAALAILALACPAYAQSVAQGGVLRPGGTPVGGVGAVQGANNNGIAFIGDNTIAVISLSPLPTAPAPVVTHSGAAGMTTYGYTICWYNQIGCSLPGAETRTTTGNATLDGTNFNVISAGVSCPAAAANRPAPLGFFAYRTTGTGTYHTGAIGSALCGGTVNDQGQFGNLVAPQILDTSVGMAITAEAGGFTSFPAFTLFSTDEPLNSLQFQIAGNGLTVIRPNSGFGAFVGNSQGTAWGAGLAPILEQAPTTADFGEFGWECDATGGTTGVTLPDANGTLTNLASSISAAFPGQIFWLKKTDSSANACTFTSVMAQTFDGAASPYSLTVQNESVMIQSDGQLGGGGGANWKIISHYVPSTGSAGKAACFKADGKTLGFCSTVVGATGGCTCN